MLKIIYAEQHLCSVSLMLTIIYALCCIFCFAEFHLEEHHNADRCNKPRVVMQNVFMLSVEAPCNAHSSINHHHIKVYDTGCILMKLVKMIFINFIEK
jgi:hypothetical protein